MSRNLLPFPYPISFRFPKMLLSASSSTSPISISAPKRSPFGVSAPVLLSIHALVVSRSTANQHSRLGFKRLSLRATSEETPNEYVVKDGGRNADVDVEENPVAGQSPYNGNFMGSVVEESPVEEQTQPFELLDNINLQVDSEDTIPILLLGGGALFSLWLAIAVVGSIDSIPVLPKLMEVVGLAYTVWFSSRYLIFKNNRKELVGKISELKQQVLGADDD